MVKQVRQYKKIRTYEVLEEIKSEVVLEGLTTTKTDLILKFNYPGEFKKDRKKVWDGKQLIRTEYLALKGYRADIQEGNIIRDNLKKYKVTSVKKGKNMICELESL